MQYSFLPKPSKLGKTIVGNRRKSRQRRLKIIGGIVTALFIFFVISIVAIVAAFGYYSKDLPSPNKLSSRDIELSTKIFDQNGKLLYDVYGDQNRTLVPLNDIPKNLRDATIAIEDKSFYKHQGFDVVGIVRSVWGIVFEHDLSGGSTLTQQLVKNALLSNERTVTRKIKEFILAVQIEKKYTKDEILQMYLNEVPYGGTAWGVEAAANMYFGKHVKDLNLVEAAILAGLPQQPTSYSPFGANPEAYKWRTGEVLRRMREDGYITSDQEKQAKKDLENVKFSAQGQNIKAPHFVMYVKEELVKKYGEKMVYQGGLQVTTSLNLDVQDIAQKAVTDQVTKEGPSLGYSNGAAMVQDPKTGEILAMVGSKDYFAKDYDGNVNVTTSLRQPGSSVKPINYVTGFKKGYTPATMFLDVKTEFPNGSGQPPYVPVNYDGKDHGPVQIRYALANSYNISAVKMLALNGVSDMVQTAKDLGITTWDDQARFGLSLTLGGGEVKLLELANAYSSFANGGNRVEPVSILKVTDSKGNVLEENKPVKGRSVLAPEHAFLISDILSDSDAKLPAFGSWAVNNILTVKGHKVAVKTGTTDEKKDNWTMGYTPSYVVGVWVGNNNGKEMNPRLASGITGAAPIWHNIFTQLLKDKPNEEFSKPDGIVQMDVDAVSGMKPGPYTQGTRKEYFAKWQVPQREDDMHKAVKLCTPTGLLATPSCDAAGQAVDKVFTVLYDPWIKQQCDPCPPDAKDTNYYSGTGKDEPMVKIKSPDAGDTVGMSFSVTTDVKTPGTVTKVDFYVDNDLQGEINTPPYTVPITLSSSTKSGAHTLTVKATDSLGNIGSDQIKINVLNPSSASSSAN
ncbi:MAG: PBP1A family penicillin-binding protein [Patescibacteria group bacterium]|nr:PBP1A family penicillin-binding protein [Patescibacteria group bacterium]